MEVRAGISDYLHTSSFSKSLSLRDVPAGADTTRQVILYLFGCVTIYLSLQDDILFIKADERTDEQIHKHSKTFSESE